MSSGLCLQDRPTLLRLSIVARPFAWSWPCSLGHLYSGLEWLVRYFIIHLPGQAHQLLRQRHRFYISLCRRLRSLAALSHGSGSTFASVYWKFNVFFSISRNVSDWLDSVLFLVVSPRNPLAMYKLGAPVRELTLSYDYRSTPNPESQTLRPTAYVRPHSAHLMSPSSDMVGPSPVTSNGTETTEIDDEEQSEPGDEPATEGTGRPPQVGSYLCSCTSLH